MVRMVVVAGHSRRNCCANLLVGSGSSVSGSRQSGRTRSTNNTANTSPRPLGVYLRSAQLPVHSIVYHRYYRPRTSTQCFDML